MPTLNLRVPPPFIAIFTALLIWLVSFTPVHFPLAHGLRMIVSVALLVAGAILGIGAVLAFRRVQTTINPLTPHATTTLVTGGVYQHSRNPMYTALALWLVAWTLYLDTVLALLCVVGFMTYMHHFQILPEERAMQSLFGKQFTVYKARVRRWL